MDESRIAKAVMVNKSKGLRILKRLPKRWRHSRNLLSRSRQYKQVANLFRSRKRRIYEIQCYILNCFQLNQWILGTPKRDKTKYHSNTNIRPALVRLMTNTGNPRHCSRGKKLAAWLLRRPCSWNIGIISGQEKTMNSLCPAKNCATRHRRCRTVLKEAILVMAGMHPITLLAAERGRIAEIRVSKLEEVEGNANLIEEHPRKITRTANRETTLQL